MYLLQWPSSSITFIAPPGWQVLQLYSLGPLLQGFYKNPHQLWRPWTSESWGNGAYLLNRAGMKQVRCQPSLLRSGCPYAPLPFQWLPVQLLEMYAPTSLSEKHVRSFHVPPTPPCDAEDLVYRNLSAFLCANLYFVEEEGDSTLHNDPQRQRLHKTAREHLKTLYTSRGNLL